MPINYNAANLDQLISNVIYGYYVKYDTLTNLIRTYYNGSDATIIDIYIDVQDILRHIDRHLSKTQLPISNPLVVTSGLINMVAHYRNFFSTRFRCNSRFWLIDSNENVLGSKYFADFRQKALSMNMAQIYRMNVQFIPLICNAITDVQYEKTSVDIVTKAISIRGIEAEINGRLYPGLLISKDPFTFQATTATDMNVLRPRKNNLGDVSEIISAPFATTAYVNELSRTPYPTTVPIDPEQLSTLMALTRVPSRNIKTKYQLNNAIEKLINGYQSGLTTKYPWDQLRFFESFLMANGERNKDPYELVCRLQACDTSIGQALAYQSTAESKLYKGIVNIYDPNGIKEINDTHFKSCPLDLNVL